MSPAQLQALGMLQGVRQGPCPQVKPLLGEVSLRYACHPHGKNLAVRVMGPVVFPPCYI